MNKKRIHAYILLSLTSFFWGIAGPIIKYTLGGVSPINFLTYRFGLSSIVALLSFTILKKKALPKKGAVWETIIFGFLTSTVALGLLFFGISKTTALETVFINLANPIITTLAGVYLLHEHVTKKEKIGISIALAGTFILITQPLLENKGNGVTLSGNILVLSYLFVNAFSAVLAKKLVRKGVSPLTMTSYSFIIGFLTILPLNLLLNGFEFINVIRKLHIQHHLGITYMALVSGNLAYSLWIKGQKTIEVGEAALFTYLYPIFATPLAIFWLHEKLTPTFFLAIPLILVGVGIAEYKKQKS